MAWMFSSNATNSARKVDGSKFGSVDVCVVLWLVVEGSKAGKLVIGLFISS